jgi:hypothetical protein
MFEKFKSNSVETKAKPANELFKKRMVVPPQTESKLKTNSSALNLQKKSGLFNLSYTNSLSKEKKHLNGKSGIGKLEILPSAPLITNSIARSKIS